MINLKTSESLEEIIQIICYNRNIELPWGKMQWKAWNSGNISMRLQLLFRPIRTQEFNLFVSAHAAISSSSISQLILTAWAELEFPATILRFILERESWGATSYATYRNVWYWIEREKFFEDNYLSIDPGRGIKNKSEMLHNLWLNAV